MQWNQFTPWEIFTFLFLMVGPSKIIRPFAELTQNADRAFTRRLAWRAILFSSFSLLLAAFVGEYFLHKYRISLPALALAAGVVLFLVALHTILDQFIPPAPGEGEDHPDLTLDMAITPLTFPIIVTPYGVAILIDFIAMSPDVSSQLMIGLVALGIMALDLTAMLLARRILRFMGVFLQIVSAVFAIIQVALGLEITISALRRLWMAA